MAVLKQKSGGVAVERSVVLDYDDSSVIHKGGTETVSGLKTFTASPLVPTVASSSDATTKAASTEFVQNVAVALFDAIYPVGSVVFGTKPAVGTWTKVGESKILSNSDDQYIVTETGRYDIGEIPSLTSKGYNIAPTKTGYDCIGIIPVWGGGRGYATCQAVVTNGGTATARITYVGIWNNSTSSVSSDMYVAWTAIFRSKYGTETVTKWKRTA